MIARALTIAGSDSGGGAGIQADLKTFTVFGVFGMSVITALTAQNTCGVSDVYPLPAAFVQRQIDAVMSDIGADVVKTGMLVNAEIIAVVARAVREHRIESLVVDPVMAAGSGAALLDDAGCAVLVKDLLPLASLITPNIPEAQALTQMVITSVADMRRAARALIELGARASLVKGGHLPGGDAVDVFDDGTAQHEFATTRLPATHTHGTGCLLSAAITAHLARGERLLTAIERSKRFVTVAIEHGLAIGRGTGPANALAWLEGQTADARRAGNG
jgi:hydroxymethylpyrimidine/phosphomethylpyrimidine kinase